MKKFISILLVAIMAVSALTGCSGSKGGTVSTDGSTSMEKVIGALGESFENDNSGVTFTYNPTGSGSGIKAVLEGRCDIGLSSRNLKDGLRRRNPHRGYAHPHSASEIGQVW